MLRIASAHPLVMCPAWGFRRGDDDRRFVINSNYVTTGGAAVPSRRAIRKRNQRMGLARAVALARRVASPCASKSRGD
jgi:hypothetical protein